SMVRRPPSFAVFPYTTLFRSGAFVEPEEEELRALPRRDRARLFAAGPATNIVLAVLFAVIFSSVMATSVQPVHDGVGIVAFPQRSEEHTSELQSLRHLVCRPL